MKKLCRMIAVCLALVLLVGIVPIQKTEAADTKDLGYYYLAKGETVIFKTDAYKGKLSIVSKGGNTVKLSGKKIKVTAKKEGYIVFKAGKKKYSFRIIVGGNNPDKKVNYKEYDWDTTDGCTNYIEWIRSKVKGGKKLPDKRFCSWHIDEDDDQDDQDDVNKGAKTYNRGLYIGERLFDVPDIYPSWCDMGYWTDSEGVGYDCYHCALYYDKKSDCVFYKSISGKSLEKWEDEVIDMIEWGCYKNNRVVKL